MTRRLVPVFTPLVISLLTLAAILVMAAASVVAKQARLRDFLALSDRIEVAITRVQYEKAQFPPEEEGQTISVTVDDLRDLFLTRAVVVSGEEVNYGYSHEPIYVEGDIRDGRTVHHFSYSLAGYGMIIEDGKIKTFFGDPTKVLPDDYYSGS